MKLIFNKKSLIRWKVYIDRSRMYIGYIQFFLIGIVFLKEYKDTSWGEKIFEYTLVSIPVSIILFILLSLVLGYLDSRLGFREEEQRNLSKSNPITMEMLAQLKEINKKIELLEERK
ncbi:MAG TPA: hypothetical protein VHO50_01350 [Bacteroidales bacterium]|nr:hypothetical protein [Bacteroidales bacterium]